MTLDVEVRASRRVPRGLTLGHLVYRIPLPCREVNSTVLQWATSSAQYRGAVPAIPRLATETLWLQWYIVTEIVTAYVCFQPLTHREGERGHQKEREKAKESI